MEDILGFPNSSISYYRVSYMQRTFYGRSRNNLLSQMLLWGLFGVVVEKKQQLSLLSCFNYYESVQAQHTTKAIDSGASNR